MKRAWPLLLVALLLAPAGAADPFETNFPRHILSASTVVGDWSVYEVQLIPGAHEFTKPSHRLFLTWRVKELHHEGSTIETEIADPPGRSVTHRIARESTRLQDLLGFGPDVVVSDVTSHDEARKVQDLEFHCRRVDFTTTENGVTQQNTVWLALSVKGKDREFNGVRMVALSTRPVSGAPRPITVEMELRGHGRANHTQWGSTAKELAGK